MKKFFVNLKSLMPLTIVWLLTIIFVSFWSIRNLSFTPSFPYYNELAIHYSRFVSIFAHFDGIHYLRLILKGYDDTGSQAFFPIYPLLIRALCLGVFDPLYVAIIFNFACLISTLYLVMLQLGRNNINKFILLFLSFPTSFFLISNYTESLFIFLITLFFYLLSKQKYFIAALIAGIASGTRLVGGLLALSLVIALLRDSQNISLSKKALLVLISLSGLIGYISFLGFQFHDPFMFIHVQSLFSNGRSGGEIIFLPQVIYRYLRILSTVPWNTILYLRAVWELVTFFIVCLTIYLFRHKLTFSSLLFCICAILLPTMSGSLSSIARYSMVLVPLFMVASTDLPPKLFWFVISMQYGILISVIALFVQGVFIA